MRHGVGAAMPGVAVRGAAMRALGGIGLVAALMAGVGSGLFHVGQALAGPGQRRAALLAAGVDPMPVGTARQVDRAKRDRGPKP
ncbi:hypothetical protein [Lichenibacterium dinghuense]|uniref:hypothetical protein n=1 Tax=Lichenibacterium dinghuense TaxID=2895977 RepID=UPI001F440A45|nr:hypothetical protein [Lichenibacterium sp. 6Y81]